MKKILLSGFGSLIALMVLTGCGNEGDGNEVNATKTNSSIVAETYTVNHNGEDVEYQDQETDYVPRKIDNRSILGRSNVLAR